VARVPADLQPVRPMCWSIAGISWVNIRQGKRYGEANGSHFGRRRHISDASKALAQIPFQTLLIHFFFDPGLRNDEIRRALVALHVALSLPECRNDCIIPLRGHTILESVLAMIRAAGNKSHRVRNGFSESPKLGNEMQDTSGRKMLESYILHSSYLQVG